MSDPLIIEMTKRLEDLETYRTWSKYYRGILGYIARGYSTPKSLAIAAYNHEMHINDETMRGTPYSVIDEGEVPYLAADAYTLGRGHTCPLCEGSNIPCSESNPPGRIATVALFPDAFATKSRLTHNKWCILCKAGILAQNFDDHKAAWAHAAAWAKACTEPIEER